MDRGYFRGEDLWEHWNKSSDATVSPYMQKLALDKNEIHSRLVKRQQKYRQAQ